MLLKFLDFLSFFINYFFNFIKKISLSFLIESFFILFYFIFKICFSFFNLYLINFFFNFLINFFFNLQKFFYFHFIILKDIILDYLASFLSKPFTIFRVFVLFNGFLIGFIPLIFFFLFFIYILYFFFSFSLVFFCDVIFYFFIPLNNSDIFIKNLLLKLYYFMFSFLNYNLKKYFIDFFFFII